MKRKIRQSDGITRVRTPPYYAAELTLLRTRARLTQVGLAAALGSTRSTVIKIEAGDRAPSPDLLKRWLAVCGESQRVDIVSDLALHAPRSRVAADAAELIIDRTRALVAHAVDDISNIMRNDPGHSVPVSIDGRKQVQLVLERLIEAQFDLCLDPE